MKYVILNTLRCEYLSEDINNADLPKYFNNKTLQSVDYEYFACNAKKFNKLDCENIVKMLNDIYKEGMFEVVEVE